MDWSNERYVRLYVRDTKTWLLLGWEGQCVLSLMLRKMDRAGVIADVKDGADLAVIFTNGMPVEVAQTGLDRLEKQGVIEITQVGIVMPNFIEAQEAVMSNKEKCRKYRETRRDKNRLLNSIEVSHSTPEVSEATPKVSKTTPGNTEQHRATPSDTPCLTVPNSAEKTYIDIIKSDKIQSKASNGPDIEVGEDSVSALVRKAAGGCWNSSAGAGLVGRLKSAYCGDGVDVDAVVMQIRNDLEIRGDDITLECWSDVSRFLNGKFRDYSRRYRLSPNAQPAKPDARIKAYNSMRSIAACIDRGLPIEPERLLFAWNTAIEDRQPAPLSVQRLVDNATSAGWAARTSNGKIELSESYYQAETAETLSAPRQDASPDEIRALVDSFLGGNRE